MLLSPLGLKQSPATLPVLEARLENEPDQRVRETIWDSIALVNLNSPNPELKVAALQRLGQSASVPAKDAITRIASDSTQTPETLQAAKVALKSIDKHIFWVDFFGTIFRGVSLGSVLLVVALGLAITFGLMGVINMAHGEIMIVGGYATFVVQLR